MGQIQIIVEGMTANGISCAGHSLMNNLAKPHIASRFICNDLISSHYVVSQKTPFEVIPAHATVSTGYPSALLPDSYSSSH